MFASTMCLICNSKYWQGRHKPCVNFSPMLPKLLLTYPHREEDSEIAIASLFLRLMLLKESDLTNQKSFST